MSKELSPLEVAKQLKDFVFELELGNADKHFVNGSFDIIEIALKKYEVLQEVHKDFIDKNIKKLKALEIIKEKRVNVRFLISCKTLKEYNDVISDHLTQEEYDLLKEVLL